jgi:hypothetical protein
MLGLTSRWGRLGSGDMGWVYLGRSRGGRHVAVKVIHAELALFPSLLSTGPDPLRR